MMIARRAFLAMPAVLALPAWADDSFRFVHFTDIHIEPELSAPEHTARCVEAINATKADFAIAGGDLVFDANLVPRVRARVRFRTTDSSSRTHARSSVRCYSTT
jgi:3',5'-cyclic-AMP phosphodiesterase